MKKSDLFHIIGSAVLLILFTVLFKSVSWGTAGTVFVGLVKEGYDCIKKNPTGFSVSDMIYNILGCLAGVIVIIVYVLFAIGG